MPISILESTPISPTIEQISVKSLLNGNIAPPGYYMLFVLSEYAVNQFVPSVAAYIKVGR